MKKLTLITACIGLILSATAIADNYEPARVNNELQTKFEGTIRLPDLNKNFDILKTNAETINKNSDKIKSLFSLFDSESFKKNTEILTNIAPKVEQINKDLQGVTIKEIADKVNRLTLPQSGNIDLNQISINTSQSKTNSDNLENQSKSILNNAGQLKQLGIIKGKTYNIGQIDINKTEIATHSEKLDGLKAELTEKVTLTQVQEQIDQIDFNRKIQAALQTEEAQNIISVFIENKIKALDIDEKIDTAINKLDLGPKIKDVLNSEEMQNLLAKIIKDQIQPSLDTLSDQIHNNFKLIENLDKKINLPYEIDQDKEGKDLRGIIDLIKNDKMNYSKKVLVHLSAKNQVSVSRNNRLTIPENVIFDGKKNSSVIEINIDDQFGASRSGIELELGSALKNTQVSIKKPSDKPTTDRFSAIHFTLGPNTFKKPADIENVGFTFSGNWKIYPSGGGGYSPNFSYVFIDLDGGTGEVNMSNVNLGVSDSDFTFDYTGGPALKDDKPATYLIMNFRPDNVRVNLNEITSNFYIPNAITKDGNIIANYNAFKASTSMNISNTTIEIKDTGSEPKSDKPYYFYDPSNTNGYHCSNVKIKYGDAVYQLNDDCAYPS